MISTDSNNTVSHDTIIANKLKNEEYKIWKKVVPSLYQHITTFKPIFKNWTPEQIESLPKCITFTNKIVSDNNNNGIIVTSLFCSLGGEVFEFNCNLPLGAYYIGDKPNELPSPQYNEHEISFIVEETQYEAKWVWNNEIIVKLVSLTENKFLALSKSGSIAMFQDGSKTPINTIMETTTASNIIVDIDISQDKTSLIKSKSDSTSKQTVIEIIDNESTWGNKQVSMSLENMIVTQIKFLDNNKIIGLCKDNRVCIWEVNSCDDHQPNWVLQLNETLKPTSIVSSPFIEQLFTIGFDNGEIRFYDLRNVQAQTTIPSKEHYLFKLIQIDNDPVGQITMSQVSPFKLISMGDAGNIYHWDLEYIFGKVQEEDFEDVKGDIVNQNDIQRECLTFFHTGGARRRSLCEGQGVNTSSYHPLIDDLVTTVDQDGLLSVYKPCLGKYIEDEVLEESAAATTEATVAAAE